jgi:hypothetical protein
MVRKNMSAQNYLVIQNNIVANICVWDGDTTKWAPPTDALVLVQETTECMVWVLNEEKTDWVLGEAARKAEIGFAWDGSKCITNEEKPSPVVQPTASGTQSI